MSAPGTVKDYFNSIQSSDERVKIIEIDIDVTKFLISRKSSYLITLGEKPRNQVPADKAARSSDGSDCRGPFSASIPAVLNPCNPG